MLNASVSGPPAASGHGNSHNPLRTSVGLGSSHLNFRITELQQQLQQLMRRSSSSGAGDINPVWDANSPTGGIGRNGRPLPDVMGATALPEPHLIGSRPAADAGGGAAENDMLVSYSTFNQPGGGGPGWEGKGGQGAGTRANSHRPSGESARAGRPHVPPLWKTDRLQNSVHMRQAELDAKYEQVGGGDPVVLKLQQQLHSMMRASEQ